MKNQRKEVQTRSVSTTVASASRAGGIVSFQIGPRLKALKDPASRKNESGFVLERQAFPALLVYGMDAADLCPLVECYNGKLVVREPKVKCSQNSYWRPLTHKFQGPREWLNPLKLLIPLAWWEPTQQQRALAQNNLRLNKELWAAHDHYKAAGSPGDEIGDTYDEAKAWHERGMELKGRSFNALCDTFLPAELLVPGAPDPTPPLPLPGHYEATATPSVTKIQPAALVKLSTAAPPAAGSKPAAEVQEIVIFGRSLDQVQRIEYLGPAGELETVDTVKNDPKLTVEIGTTAIQLTARVKKSTTGSFKLTLNADGANANPAGGPAVIFTPAITFIVDDKAPGVAAAYDGSAVSGLTASPAPPPSPHSATPERGGIASREAIPVGSGNRWALPEELLELPK